MTTANHTPARGKSGISFYAKLAFLYFLNLIDWLCTEALLGSGRFAEANPIMSPVLTSFWSTLLIKGVLPLALSVFCAVVYKLSNIEYSRFADILLNIGIFAYSAVNLWHIINFLLLFSVN